MANLTITKTITQPEEVIAGFAADLGYLTDIPNGAYVEGGSEPQSIPNPQTPVDFVSEQFDIMVTDWFTQFAKRNALRDAEAAVEASVETQKEAIKATIQTS